MVYVLFIGTTKKIKKKIKNCCICKLKISNILKAYNVCYIVSDVYNFLGVILRILHIILQYVKRKGFA